MKKVGVYLAIMSQNRIEDNESLLKMVQLAQNDPSLIPAMASQLVDKEDIPDPALKILPIGEQRKFLDQKCSLKLLNAYLNQVIPSFYPRLLMP